MDKLYAPWRNNYVRNEDKVRSDACVFCTIYADDAALEAHWVLAKVHGCMIILNTYPYNGGHLMVIPGRHVASLTELSADEQAQLMQLSAQTIEIMQRVLQPEGFNFGANFGRAAGAGIPQHLHLHVVPRWNGDTNFLPVIGDTKAISIDLADVYHRLKPEFEKI